MPDLRQFNYQPLSIRLSDAWQNILWREWHYCRDEAYADRLKRLLADTPAKWGVEWQDRPLAAEVETALEQACQESPAADSSWQNWFSLLRKAQRNPDPVDQLLARLRHADWQRRFIARHALVALGGEAAPHLLSLTSDQRSLPVQLVNWLLQSIEFETTARLFPYMARLVCSRCLVRCHANWAERLIQMPFVFYGCRACGQSREFLDWPGSIVTVLDRDMDVPYLQQTDTLRGNWLAHRSLFDCDWVEIIRASDEEIEYFVVQTGNDTDQLRQPYYKQMRCLLGPDCRPSEATLRILQSRFGQVEWLRTA